ncbi:MAG: KH domain-containing protein [bacterium]|nr:KH domain-containing protein [bacterium]
MSKKGLFSFFKGKESEESTLESSAVADSNISPKLVNGAKELLEELLKRCGFEGDVTARIEEELISLEIEETDDTGRIIGRDGNTVESLQTLIKAMMFKTYGERVKVAVDAGGYKQKRMDKAQNQALQAAQLISKETNKQELNPMSAAERRAIHMLFKEHEELMSYSVGEGPTRRVVIERRAETTA